MWGKRRGGDPVGGDAPWAVPTPTFVSMRRALCFVSVVLCLVTIAGNVEPSSRVLWHLGGSHGIHLFDLFPLVLAVAAFGLAARDEVRS